MHVTFGLTIEKLWDFEDFNLSLSMLSATMNATKSAESAQNCPKLPKFTKICPKMKLWNAAKNRDFSVYQK